MDNFKDLLKEIIKLSKKFKNTLKYKKTYCNNCPKKLISLLHDNIMNNLDTFMFEEADDDIFANIHIGLQITNNVTQVIQLINMDKHILINVGSEIYYFDDRRQHTLEINYQFVSDLYNSFSEDDKLVLKQPKGVWNNIKFFFTK